MGGNKQNTMWHSYNFKISLIFDQKRRSKIPKIYDTEISLSAAWKVGGKKQMRGTGTIVLLRSTITNEDMSIWKANRNFIFVGEMRIEERFEERW